MFTTCLSCWKERLSSSKSGLIILGYWLNMRRVSRVTTLAFGDLEEETRFWS